jgi:predicted GNAT family acetyltransferase
MAGVSDSSQVTDNEAASRFELTADGGLGELVYRLRDGRLVILHSEVPEALGGRGLGGQLVSAAVDRAARDGLTVVPLCPFARSWLERNPEAAERVPVDWSGSEDGSAGGQSPFRGLATPCAHTVVTRWR